MGMIMKMTRSRKGRRMRRRSKRRRMRKTGMIRRRSAEIRVVDDED